MPWEWHVSSKGWRCAMRVLATRSCCSKACSTPTNCRIAARERFELVVHSLEQVAQLEQAAVTDPFTVWLKLDTGMNRLGLDCE